MTTDDILDSIIKREGAAYTNDPDDKGGPTKYGITQETLSAARGHDVTADDVEALSEEEARGIYREKYVKPWQSVVPPKVLPLVVDCYVNHRPQSVIKMLQEAVKVEADGVLGGKTYAAIVAMDADLMYRRLCAARVRLYGRIVHNDPSQVKFISGWLNRAAEFVEA